MDDVRLYKNALSAERIEQIYNISAETGDMIGWWKFEGNLNNSLTHRSNPPGSAQLSRKEFEITRIVKRARVYFSGLGFSELYLNGNKIGDDVLSPAFTDYNKVINYMTYDITSELRIGMNAVGVFLGNGWYSARILDYPECWSEKPQLLLQLNIEFEDGSRMNIVSDNSWKTSVAPIGENDINFGENYDARKEQEGWNMPGFNDYNWMQAEENSGPAGKLTSQLMPAMKITETVYPVKLNEPEPGTFVYHFDQLFGGWSKLHLKGEPGKTVTIEYSTRLLKNGLFNSIHDNVNRTLSNSLKGYLQDCLHREPYGYNEPASIAASLFTRKFMPLFWNKYACDIKLAARDDGSVGDVIPAFPGKPRDPDVSQGSAYPMLIWYLYQAFADLELLDEHYQTIKDWVDYIGNHMCEGQLVVIGWLGDHMVPGPAPGYEKWRSDETPQSLSWTALYYRNVKIMAEMAKTLGKGADASFYHDLAEKIKKAFNDKWLDETNSHYGSRSQTAELLPLSLGLVPEEHKEELIKNIAQNISENDKGHLRVGHAGITALIEALTANGLGEVMYGIVNTRDYPGWGYMVEQGATTIWECWGRDFAVEGGRRRSDNMTMLAGVNEFFYRYIAGIHGPEFYGPENMVPGYQEFRIKPFPVGNLTHAKASVNTVRGEIRSAWEIINNTFRLDVEIPVNSEAFVSIPKFGKESISVSENGKIVWGNGMFKKAVEGVYEGVEEADYITFKAGSGNYSFILSNGL